MNADLFNRQIYLKGGVNPGLAGIADVASVIIHDSLARPMCFIKQHSRLNAS
jgi:hypothetical protein